MPRPSPSDVSKRVKRPTASLLLGGLLLAVVCVKGGQWLQRGPVENVAREDANAPAAISPNLKADESKPMSLADHVSLRRRLDDTVWKKEVVAQQYEQRFVDLWDELRRAGDKFATLASFPFRQLRLGTPGKSTSIENGIQKTIYANHNRTEGATIVSHNQFVEVVKKFADDGYRIVQTEWHHNSFHQADGEQPGSTVSFVFHVQRDASGERSQTRLIVRGLLRIAWATSDSATAMPVPDTIEVRDLRIYRRDGAAMFEKTAMLDASKLGRGTIRLEPLSLYDLDGDGSSEIVLGGVNLALHVGSGKLLGRDLLDDWRGAIGESAILADFTGDGQADYLCNVAVDQRPALYVGDAQGRFSSPRRPIDALLPEKLQVPSVMTAGDVDSDGDLDVWLTQYRPPYVGGQMPTPYFDANDGFPSYLLLNDGKGNFVDATAEAGLTERRFRRTYSSSFVDLNGDGHLDLLVVSDFSGVDVYSGDGKGHFRDVRDEWLDEWHNFGMSHTLDDFDLDGRLDFFVTGMSSTTMRRLEQMKLGRPEFPQHDQNRRVMGYGNRMYMARGQRFAEPETRRSVARTGWSWGCTSADFDNDGDRDLYVANGHISGESAKDYCTQFWRHDIYTGGSEPNRAIESLLQKSLEPIVGLQMSWNGFEHNVLLINRGDGDFVNVAFLMGVSLEEDCRAVVSDDLNGDGRIDLVVVQEKQMLGGLNNQILHVLTNRSKNDNHWIGVRLREAGAGRSPIGAKITVRHSGRDLIAQLVTGDSFHSQHAPVAHFGLGSASQVENIEVRWTNGQVQRIDNPAVDRYHLVDPPGP